VTVLASEGHADAIARRAVELGAAAPASRVAAADVGYYMDVQQARLQQLGTDRVRVVRKGARLVLTLLTGSGFESGSFRLTRDAEATLASLAATLREFDKTLVSVHGHTDASGGAAANIALSERRALAVARFLVENGVDRRRLVAVGRGQSDPVASNDTEEGRQQNRRIEVQIDAIGGR
jgi:outer membrane protein OmpA-like peptidoglycan-associated protein